MVDHPCTKCGVLVEDGRPFCPHCRAPQIHVQTEVASEAASSAVIADSFPTISHHGEFGPAVGGRLAELDRAIAARSALKAGVLGLFIGIIPFLGIVLTGALAVYFFQRERGREAQTGLGARLGAAAGVVTFAVNSLLIVIRIFVFHAQQEYIDWILKIAQATGYNTADPAVQASVHNLFSPSGMILLLFFVMIFTLALGAVGGALGAMFLRKTPRT